MTGNLGQFEADWWRPVSESSLLLTEPIHEVGAGGSQRCDEHSLFLPIVGKRMMQEVARGQPNGLAAFDNGADDVGSQEGITDCLAHAVRWDGVFGGNLLIGFACFDSFEPVCWFSVKMTASLDVNATPGGRMSPIAPGIVPECSGASRVKRATRAGFAALDAPSALWYSLLVGERERSGAPGIRVFMRAPCYYAALAATLVPAPVSGPAPTRSLGPCQP